MAYTPTQWKDEQPPAINATNLNKIEQGIKDAHDALLNLPPPGSIIAYGGDAPPDGWLHCNGQAVSRTTYAALFAAIGTRFGAGNGSTTFNVPDLRGEFLRGWDAGRGVDSGRSLGSAQGDAFRSHTHTSFSVFQSASQSGDWTTSSSLPSFHRTSANTGATGGAETRPRNVAVMYLIKT